MPVKTQPLCKQVVCNWEGMLSPLGCVPHTFLPVGKTQLETENEMTDQEKIELLSEALNNLTQSVDCYLEDKSTFATETLSVDIDHAWAVLNKLPPKSWNL
jgi:hypothetical protein